MSISEDEPLERISALVGACLREQTEPKDTLEQIAEVLASAGYDPREKIVGEEAAGRASA